MKILFIIPIYLKNINEIKNLQFMGGGGRYPYELAKSISDLGKDDVELIYFGKSYDSIESSGMRITLIPSINFAVKFNGFVNPLPLSLKFFQRIAGADIIHSIQIRTEATMLATLFGKLIGKTVFLTDNNFNGLSLSRIIRVEHLADAVLTISEEDYQSWNVKNKKIIYGGVDSKNFPYKKQKQKYVIYAGRIAAHKGVDVLVDAMPADYRLIIAGSTLEKDYLKYLKKISKNKKVDFFENPSDKKLISLYQNASCFVLPATAKDYLGVSLSRPGLYALVVPEAMSCGTPVMVSNVGALPYFIENDKNGYVFKDRDIDDLRTKLKKIIYNKSVIERMGKNGRRLVEEKYNWNNIAKKARKIYLESRKKPNDK